MNVFFIPIILTLELIEIFDVDKRKFKIKNDFDRIIINDREEILHNNIIKVSIIAYVKMLTKECFQNPNVKWRPFFHGIGYGKFEARNVLKIEYNNGYRIKKKKFELRYVNKERLEEFLNLFKEEA